MQIKQLLCRTIQWQDALNFYIGQYKFDPIDMILKVYKFIIISRAGGLQVLHRSYFFHIGFALSAAA